MVDEICNCRDKPINIRKIVIEGPQIQGVTLREKIKKIADDIKIRGFVRNLKDKKTVEIICIKDDNYNNFFDVLNKIKNDDKFEINKITEHDHLLDENHFKDFEIKREDDLQEMVWALQGAGKMFELTEKRRVKGQVKALIYGLSEITDWLNSGKIVPLEPIALNNFLINCPIDNEQDLIENLQTINSEIRELNHLINGKDEIGAKNKIETLREKRFGDKEKYTFFEFIDYIQKKIEGV